MARTSTEQTAIAAAAKIIYEEQQAALDNAAPYYYVEHAFVPVGATTATVYFRLSAPAVQEVTGKYYTQDGDSVKPYKSYGVATSNANYYAITATKFKIPVGGTSVAVTVNLKATSFVDKHFRVYFYELNGANAKGLDYTGLDTNIMSYVIMQANRSAYAPAKYELAYYDDLVTTFEANDLGIGTNQATWSTRMGPSNRYQSGNSEASIYADATLYPTTNPHPNVGGIRQLRVGKPSDLGTITWNGYTKSYYGSALISRGFIHVSRGYVEAKIKLTTLRGSWPAFWLLPSNAAWPPELDIMEQPVNQYSSPEGNALLYTTQHFMDGSDQATGNHKQIAYKTNIQSDAGVTNQTDYFVMGSEITDDRWRVWINNYKVVDMPMRVFEGNSWYILFDNTLGGWGAQGVTIDDANLPGDFGIQYVSVYRDVGLGNAPQAVTIMPKVTSTRKGAYFDPDGVSCYLNLSNGNATVTSVGHREGMWARSYGCASTSEKVYAKVGFSNSTSGAANYFLTFSAGNLGLVNGSTSTGCIQLARSGTVSINGTTIGTAASNSTDGAQVEVAFDRVNNRIWFKVNGGNWNNSGSADPATNTGGFDTSTFQVAPASGSLATPALAFLRIACAASSTPDSNLGESVSFLTGTVPSGFVSI